MSKIVRNQLACICMLYLSILTTNAQDFSPIKQLAQRRVPWLLASLEFGSMPKENGNDVFELSSVNNKIHIAASGANAAAMGLNWYLKYYCHRSMSHLGDNLMPLQKIPLITGKIKQVAAFPLRYALNYCTINYTMSFYRWKGPQDTGWERELDWMALNGINLVLMPVGAEAVWQNTLRQFGFSEKEIFDFIPGPAFSAWWLMGNLEGWGGPVTQAMIDQQKLLGQTINKRMQELGIDPVVQGFYGMVPTKLKEKMQVKVVEQGRWAGGFLRPDFLLPADSQFEKMAEVYYAETKKIFGSNIRYFGGDPFHEGGSSKGVDVKQAATIIQQQMQKQYPGSTWILQGWQSNPSSALLSGLDKSKTLVIELFGENTANWEKRKGYEGTPFVWAHVSNFGEKNGLYGKLQRFAAETYRAKNSEYKQLLKGVGFIPEGINNNPVTFDLVAELAWHADSVIVKDWIKKYVHSRYGTSNEKLQEAWQLLLQTVYSSPDVYQEGPSESIFCARPGTGIKSVSSWGTRKRNYDPALFEKAVRLFIEAGKELRKNEAFATDEIDFVRQLQANRADIVYEQMTESIEKKNETGFLKAYRKFETMLLQQDSLLNSSSYFSLHRWLQQANDFGVSSNEKEIALLNAKMQITYWGPDDPKTDLHEYAHKEWGGLLSSLYLQRWRKFADIQVKKIKGETVTEEYFSIEKRWADDKTVYPMKKLPARELNDLIKRIIN